MSEEKQAEQPVGPFSVEYPFKVRSVTARDVQKMPGPVQYSSRETGTPYMTIDLDWPGVLRVKAPAGGEDVPNPKDPEMIGLAFQALLLWVKDNAAAVGREVVADIQLGGTEATLDRDSPSVDINEL